VAGKPSVSVIIPSYNCARYVCEAVDSVLAQTSPADEIIVVDDGSTDDTRARLEAYRDRTVYIEQPHSGVARARNRGIEDSSGTLIAFLDADDRWLPEKLERQLEHLASHARADLIHTNFLHWNDRTGELTRSARNPQRASGRCYLEFFWYTRVMTSSILLTRRCLDRVGGFDEHIPGRYAEDIDLCLRIARAHELAYLPEPLVLYRRHEGNTTAPGYDAAMAECILYVFEKALADDPAVRSLLGEQQIAEALRAFAFYAGYQRANAGELAAARRDFRAALRYAPRSLYAWSMWGSTFLPAPLRFLLRAAKQHLVARAQRGIRESV